MAMSKETIRETIWIVGHDGKIKRKRRRIKKSGNARKAYQAM
jgi:hypothetical protein